MSTFGLWNITPNFYNAVPRSVRVDIDIRDSDKERRDSIVTQTLEGAEKIAKQRKCGYSGGVQWQYPIATSNKTVHGSLKPSCQGFYMPILPSCITADQSLCFASSRYDLQHLCERQLLRSLLTWC